MCLFLAAVWYWRETQIKNGGLGGDYSKDIQGVEGQDEGKTKILLYNLLRRTPIHNSHLLCKTLSSETSDRNEVVTLVNQIWITVL